MSINWMTLLAQVANFLILIWLLKRFLYQPVRRMIAERNEKLTAHIRKGEVMQEEARRREQLYESKLREFDAEREHMLRDVRDEAEQLRRQLHDEAIQKANKERTLLLDELRKEKQQFEQHLREQVLDQACEIAAQVVSDLAHRRLEGALIDVLTERVDEAEASRSELTPSVQPNEAGTGPAAADLQETVTVRTSFEPTDAQQERLAKLAIRFAAQPGTDVSFEVDPSLVLGVELISTTEAVSWAARDYLNSLQEVALERLVQGMKTDKTGAVAGD